MGNIKAIKYVGEGKTCDLEVYHPDHQFYTANGILSSNSHATLYSMVGYKTAYLKAHFPVEFLLSNLMFEVNSNAPNAKTNIQKIKKEFAKYNIKIVAPNINKSELTYTIINENQLLTGLNAIKNVGDEAIKDIVAKRPFTSFFDFMVRVDSHKVRANNIQALIASGAFDDFKISRKLMFLYCADYRKKLQSWCKKHDPTKEEFIYPWANEGEWTIPELYALEQHYMDEAFICKPYKAYGTFFAKEHITFNRLRNCEDKTKVPTMIGIVKEFFEFKVKKETSKYYGHSMIKCILEDMKGDQISCTIFSDRWQQVQERLKQIKSNLNFDVGLALHFSGSVNFYEDNRGIILDKLFDVCLPKSLPEDLKHKKINMKIIKEEINTQSSENKLLENLEQQLFDEGLIDLDSEEDSD